MKTVRMLSILVLALGLTVWTAAPGLAWTVGTAFTYQGRLIDANDAADGEYDFQFKLFDDPNANLPIAEVSVSEVDVIGGYFTVELDFGGGMFDGDARWLGIGIRSGGLADPNDYTSLSPRQEVAPAPYALYAEKGGSDDDWIVVEQNMHAGVTGNVGIGVMMPSYKLDVDGNIKATSGRFGTDLLDSGANLQVANRINIMDGVTVHPSLYLGDGGLDYLRLFWNSSDDYGQISTPSGHNLVIMPGDNLGIGTFTPEEMLDVRGNLEVDQKILAHDAGGLELATAEGTTRLYIADYGWVGIGTDTPEALLDVRGDIEVDRKIKAHDADGLELATREGTVRLKITSDGNVGIGSVTPDAKLEVDGDLKLTGAYKGNIGPNNGAPFPRPAYDSGWVAVAQDETVELIHNTGGNVDNYVVDMQFKSVTSGIHNLRYGGDDLSLSAARGAAWHNLTSYSIKVYRTTHDVATSQIRIRIWVYN